MKEGKTKQIDELVDQVLRNMGLEQKFKEHEVCMIWPEVVGQMIASRTKSVRVMDGKLFVSFTSAASVFANSFANFRSTGVRIPMIVSLSIPGISLL